MITIGSIFVLTGVALLLLSRYMMSEDDRIRERIDEYFQNVNFGVSVSDGKVLRPLFDRVEKTEDGKFMYYDLPVGLGLDRVKEHKQGLEMALGFDIELYRHKNQLQIKLHDAPLSDYIEYDFERIKETVEGRGITIPVVLGECDGEVLVLDLAEVKHLSIGGATGKGKSNMMRVIINTMACLVSPELLNIVIIDLKQGVEGNTFAHLPHVKTVASNTDQALIVLKLIVEKMKQRLKFFREEHFVGIQKYNFYHHKKMPHLLVFVDEMGELNPEEAPEAPRYIPEGEPLPERHKRQQCQFYMSEIARLGRASGIHLFTATQRPDSNVMPKYIQQNMDARVAFYCPDEYSSEIILGKGHVEACDPSMNIPGRFILRYKGYRKGQAFYLGSEEAEQILQREAWVEPPPEFFYEKPLKPKFVKKREVQDKIKEIQNVKYSEQIE